jgi:hypothetical protein
MDLWVVVLILVLVAVVALGAIAIQRRRRAGGVVGSTPGSRRKAGSS